MKVPVIVCNAHLADAAFAAYAALRKAGRDDPALLGNPYFTALVDTAAARFRSAFEVV